MPLKPVSRAKKPAAKALKLKQAAAKEAIAKAAHGKSTTRGKGRKKNPSAPAASAGSSLPTSAQSIVSNDQEDIMPRWQFYVVSTLIFVRILLFYFYFYSAQLAAAQQELRNRDAATSSGPNVHRMPLKCPKHLKNLRKVMGLEYTEYRQFIVSFLSY